MCGLVDNLFSGDNFLSTIASVASVIPGPWQVPAMMTSGVLNLANDNLLGSALSFTGGMGGFGNLGATVAPDSNMLGGLTDLYDEIGSGLGSAASSTAGGAFGGLEDVFSGMALPSVGGGASVGAGDVFGMFPEAMEGFGGDTLGGGLGTTMSGVGAMGGGTEGMSPMTGLDSFNLAEMPAMDTSSFAAQMPAQNTNFMDTLQNLFEQGQEVADSPWAKVAGGLAKGFGAYQDYRGARNAQKAYQRTLDSLDQLYSPDSPYAQTMRRNIERRDAARGRRSQYGPRERELAASLTNSRAAVLNSPGYIGMTGAANQSAVPYGSLFGAGKSILSGLGGLFG